MTCGCFPIEWFVVYTTNWMRMTSIFVYFGNQSRTIFALLATDHYLKSVDASEIEMRLLLLLSERDNVEAFTTSWEKNIEWSFKCKCCCHCVYCTLIKSCEFMNNKFTLNKNQFFIIYFANKFIITFNVAVMLLCR